MIPVSCLLEVFFDKIHYSRHTKLSICLVLLGVGVCTVTDVSVNTQGFIAAFIAVWSTALQQYVRSTLHFVFWPSSTLHGSAYSVDIYLLESTQTYSWLSTLLLITHKIAISFVQYVHYLQRKYSLSSFNLLGHTAPAQAASLLLVGPFLDYFLTSKRVDRYDFDIGSLVSSGTNAVLHANYVHRVVMRGQIYKFQILCVYIQFLPACLVVFPLKNNMVITFWLSICAFHIGSMNLMVFIYEELCSINILKKGLT